MASPICMKCKHYYSTWDPATPRGCKIYKIQSAQMPSMIIKKETGQDCLGYEIKAVHQKKKELDLNDDSLWKA